MNYEVSHIYSNQKIGNIQENGIRIFNEIRKEDSNLEASLMIDDYSDKRDSDTTNNIENIVEYYKNSIPDITIYYESEFVKIASLLEDRFQIKKETFRKQQKVVSFIVINGEKIKLKEERSNGEVKFACPALSASFHLARAGMIEGNIITNPKENIFSILPHKYYEVEAQVQRILIALGCKNQYLFY